MSISGKIMSARSFYAAVFSAVSLLSVSARGVDWPEGTTKSSDVVLGSDEAPLASGDIVLPATGAEARTLTVKQEFGASQTVTGGQLAFGDGAVIAPGNGDLAFSVPITAGNGLAISREDRVYSFETPLPTPESNSAPVEVFSDVDLAFIVPVSATTMGSNMNGHTYVAAVQKRGEGWLEVQYQLRASESAYVKVIKVRYEQASSSDPVTAYVVYGKYIHVADCGHPVPLGTDMDDPVFDRGQPGVNFYSTQYGIAAASFVLKRPTVSFNGVPRFEGTLSCSAGAELDVLFAKDDPAVFTNAVSLFSDTAFRTAMPKLTFNPESIAFDAGNSMLELVYAAAEGAAEEELSRTYAFTAESFFPAEWTLVFTNQVLTNLTGISDVVMGGGSATGGDPVLRFFRNDGLRASFQICMDVPMNAVSNLYKTVLVELRQSVAGIELRSPRSGYIRGASSDYPEGYDVLTHGWVSDQSWSPTVNNYNANSATFTFKRAPRVFEPAYVSATSGSGAFNGKSISLVSSSDTMLWCETPTNGTYFARALRAGCFLDIHEGTVLTTPKDAALALGNAEVYLHPGSVFMPRQQGLRYGTKHTVDHAMIILGGHISDNRFAIGTDSAVYIGKTELNGGRLAGAAVRFGIGGTAHSILWAVGDAPSRADNHIQIYSAKGQETEVTFAISDVTGDSSADFVVGGGLVNPITAAHGPNYGFTTVAKTGDGTMRIDGICNYTNLVDVRSGTIEFTADGGAGEEGKYRLSGGALAFGAGTSHTVKSLEVSAEGGQIVLGEGAEFTVPDADALTLEGNLAVTQDEGGRVRIGSQASSAQLGRIRVNGRMVTQSGDGSLVFVGFVFSLR